jgi:hypothetical protein
VLLVTLVLVMKQLSNSRVLGAICVCLSLAWNSQARAENAVRYSDAATEAGGTVTVDVVLENDVAIAGAAIPFRWSSADLTLDSISFVRDRYQGDLATRGSRTPDESQMGAILIVSNWPRMGWLNAGSGVVARLHFRVAESAASQWALIDSVYEPLSGGVRRVTEFSDISGTRVIPAAVYNGTVTIGHPAGQALISTVPERLEFHATRNGPAPVAQAVSIRSIGGPPLTWVAGSTAAWMSVSPLSGRAPGELQVSVDPAGLEPGEYSDSITISSADAINSPVRLPVALTVEAATEMIVTPGRLEFRNVLHGPHPPNQTLQLQSSNAVSLAWSSHWSSTWLVIYPTSGDEFGQVSTGVDASLLDIGAYNDTVVFTASGAANSPVRIPVTLVVDPTASAPSSRALGQNRPNPFSTYQNPLTSVTYTLEKPDRVEITLYDVLGRPVRHLVAGEISAGAHVVTWDGRDDHGRSVASGHYFYRMKTSAGSETRQMVLIK